MIYKKKECYDVKFIFGLANFLSLSDRMSDMLKKFSTSLRRRGLIKPLQKEI